MSSQYLPHFSRHQLDDDVGPRIRAARGRQGKSRIELAAAAGIKSRTLARIERGDQMPRVGSLRAIAEALEMPLEALVVNWTDDERRRRENSDHLGPRLRQARRKAGVTLAKAAASAGVSPTTLSRFERMQTDSLLISIDGVTFQSDALAHALKFRSCDDLSAACADFY